MYLSFSYFKYSASPRSEDNRLIPLSDEKRSINTRLGFHTDSTDRLISVLKSAKLLETRNHVVQLIKLVREIRDLGDDIEYGVMLVNRSLALFELPAPGDVAGEEKSIQGKRDVLSEMLATLKRLDENRNSSWKLWRKTDWYPKYGRWIFGGIWWFGVLALLTVVHGRGIQYRGDKEHTATYAHWLHTATMLDCAWGLLGRLFDVVTDEVVFFWMVEMVEMVQVVVELAFELGA